MTLTDTSKTPNSETDCREPWKIITGSYYLQITTTKEGEEP